MHVTEPDSPGPQRDLVGYGGKPPEVVWPGNARIAILLVVNYEEGSEASVGDGDPKAEQALSEFPTSPWPDGKRDLAVESMYEYGARAGYWRLLDIFDELDVKCTFYACAVALERNRAAAREMVRRGHDIMCHGWRWEDVALLTREQEREHIRMAVKSIEETTGVRPRGWYCRSRPSTNTRELVVEEGGFLYDSDAYNDDLPYWEMVGDKKHLVIPYSLVNNDSGFGRGAFGPPNEFEEHLRYTFDRLYREGEASPKMMNIGLHMRVVGHPARAKALYDFIQYAKSHADVWFATRIDVARHWMEKHA
ncbi:allantoinase PuuE [Verticiella sediminum]|uniref:Allantoinase PuuE n=1 Tax=Verticiella sediminum TaxID=1247510 RepID=A0A556AIU9_9BURK|nr:allantoinase PuuE [Verticiella sediminum]TSH92799.1 allantoinase PuuE [Verticiella sediminum]